MLNGAEIQNSSRAMLNCAGCGGGGIGNTNEILEAGTTSHVFGRLAKETGGFVIENTNDLAAGFRRIDADRRFHYLLTYTPANADCGGEYRRIEVTVARRGAVVRARSGYRADRSLAVIPTLAYEAGPAAALKGSPLPSDIPIRQTLVTAPVQMAAPGPDGFNRQVVRLPLPALAPGSYTVRLDLGDGQNQTGRTARLGPVRE